MHGTWKEALATGPYVKIHHTTAIRKTARPPAVEHPSNAEAHHWKPRDRAVAPEPVSGRRETGVAIVVVGLPWTWTGQF